MPASARTRGPRNAALSRPYGRHSPTASPTQTEQPLVLRLPYSIPPASPTLPDSGDVDQDAPDPSPDTTPLDRPGLPTYATYKCIEANYLGSLSPRKRDKALITQAMFDKIWDVLHQPDACTIETPQFRFWVRKMFVLSRPVWTEHEGVVWSPGGGGGEMEVGTGMGTGMGGKGQRYLDSDSDGDTEAHDLALERAMGISDGSGSSAHLFSAVVLHEHRPVAIMEQLYELFCYCHVRAGHGGRDKTCAVIREHYSWVPKELTAQFVKACPTCAVKRSGGGVSLGVNMDVGAVTVRKREREKRTTAPVVQPSPALMWPTTGGPLDPANPQPCGVRKRAWPCVQQDATRSTPVSPANDVKADVAGSFRQWNTAVDAPPFRFCDVTAWQLEGSSSRITTYPRPQESGGVRTDVHEGDTHSPTRPNTGLPSLASALSNGSLDNIRLSPTRLQRDTGECVLPPVLHPLRLSGPCVPEPSSSSSSSSSPLSLPSSSEMSLDNPNSPSARVHAHLFPIDPVLLSFDYPGFTPDLDAHGDAGFTSPYLAVDSPDTYARTNGMMRKLFLTGAPARNGGGADAEPDSDGSMNMPSYVDTSGMSGAGKSRHRRRNATVDAVVDGGRASGRGRRKLKPRPHQQAGHAATIADATALSPSFASEPLVGALNTNKSVTRRRGSPSSLSGLTPYEYPHLRENGPSLSVPLAQHPCVINEGLGGAGQERSPLAIVTDA